ncbi:hypothetical protein L484_018728 [Morus notabilis]|uniref:Uncharacterized protein n=1 Tax=Morus notabilis TaxID=981085 RepID=W9RGC1_9ROSA|nr:hypothetical protein L484_018728 [Morus notabilis]
MARPLSTCIVVKNLDFPNVNGMGAGLTHAFWIVEAGRVVTCFVSGQNNDNQGAPKSGGKLTRAKSKIRGDSSALGSTA